MDIVRSPLGALGALMVLLEGIATAALFPLKSQPGLQEIIVWTMAVSLIIVVLCVVGLVAYLTKKNPALLFNPRDIDASAHIPIYAPQETAVVTKDIYDNLNITYTPDGELSDTK